MKKYLSYPALYTHKKLKHEKNNEQNRKKGRPKKNQNENIIEKNKYNPVNITFFAKEERTGKTSYNEINSCIDDVFIELYVEDEIALKKYNSLGEHPFLNKFKNDNHDIYKNAINMHEITDKVFIDYLNKMSAFCNKNYFVKLICSVGIDLINFSKYKYDKNIIRKKTFLLNNLSCVYLSEN